jgi:DNA replication protein DnaC
MSSQGEHTTDDEMQTLGSALGGARGLIQMGGEVPCANGCGRMAREVKLVGRPIPAVCTVCAEESERRLAEQERREMIERLMNLSGRTPKLMLWDLESYPQDAEGKRVLGEAMSWLKLYREEGPMATPNLILLGGVGTGKSGLGWSLVRELIEKDGIRARFVNWRLLLQEMQEAFGRKDLTVQAALGLDRLPVICLDDVGSERVTDWRAGELANLVERREQNLLPTIYTLNYTLAELAARLGKDDPAIGERIVSRMMENAQVVKFAGADRRTVRARNVA